MLFILTGDVRTGKTTWLQERVRETEAAGIPVHGVLAPGVWRDGKKTGIENVLLPSREHVLLATPSKSGCSGGLGWDFDETALAHVNAHLTKLAAAAGKKALCPGFLVIDEIGPLELRRGGGLTSALALLEAGPAPAWPSALVVVRSTLTEEVAARWHPAWGTIELVHPNENGANRLREALLDGRSWRGPEK